ncbi:uncharacterized protein LOC116349367 [Contarinia nasturtii]|uniref:uncharacterized protein LOC116349367 n=1 Tax=Contarinia nasturtii TaxID=265458 RepID=UPI0012D3A696|nr:uncharacterized protein LOC116349367 [Contarinia nasturtii]
MKLYLIFAIFCCSIPNIFAPFAGYLPQGFQSTWQSVQDTYLIPGAMRLMTGYTAVKRYYDGEPAEKILKDIGADAFLKNIPNGQAILVGIQVTDDIRNGKDPIKIFNEVGRDAFIKYIPNGEAIANAIATTIEIGQCYKNGTSKQAMMKKYGQPVLDKYANREMLGDLMKQALNIMPASITAAITPTPKVVPKIAPKVASKITAKVTPKVASLKSKTGKK